MTQKIKHWTIFAIKNGRVTGHIKVVGKARGISNEVKWMRRKLHTPYIFYDKTIPNLKMLNLKNKKRSKR